MGKLGLTLAAVFLLVALAAPVISPYHPKDDVDASLQSPSAKHLLGTDDVGRDILSQIISGTRVSLTVGVAAGLAATTLGVLVGLVAGYFGGMVDRVLMRAVDLFLALPRLPLLMLLAAYLGGGVWVVVTAFVLVAWAFPARVVRAQVLVERRRAYVISAKLSGARWTYVLRKHIAPSLGPLLLAIVLMECSHAIMAEAGLSFLGLGDPTRVSWGTIMHYAFAYPSLFLSRAWLWWALPPGLCLSVLLLALAFISMSVESRLDPRLKGARLGQ